MPYFSYAKGDKKDEPRVSIRARVCADAIEVAGANRIVTLDLHAPQIQGFFRIPVDDLYALPVLGAALRRLQLPDLEVVSPDTGFAKHARKYASSWRPPSPSPTSSARDTTSAPRSWKSSDTWRARRP
jgi:ribose-phosphate pyrophosphokinase